MKNLSYIQEYDHAWDLMIIRNKPITWNRKQSVSVYLSIFTVDLEYFSSVLYAIDCDTTIKGKSNQTISFDPLNDC